jgi:hypothetical protein
MPAQEPNSKDTRTIATPWPSVSDWWTPAISGCAAANGKLHQPYLDFSVEWQTFVGRRFSEDFHLLQELSAAKAPDQVWNAWSRFWRETAEDYGREYSIMAKLAAGFVPKIAPLKQDDSRGETLTRQPQSKAA